MLECDYLVVGTGASGMAFADAVVTESTDRTIIMVDKLPNPGGHWNHAYEFVRLHQPACYYGVASEKLEREGETALYKYKDLSSKREILDYYRFVMDKMIKTGRVRHYGECSYEGNIESKTDHSFVDKEGVSHKVHVKRRVVDATYLGIRVPSTHPPRYKIEQGVKCVPINAIYGMSGTWAGEKKFVVVGAGKTGIDAVLYLLDIGIDPDNITWVMSRDAWLLSRTIVNPQTWAMKGMALMMNGKESLKESLLKQEEDGLLMRLDGNRWPEKYNCATVEDFELERLRSVKSVIRQGRVESISKSHLVMTGNVGNEPQCIPYEEGSIFVDCSACGLPPKPEVPIFQEGKIVIQPIVQCMVSISAASIAYVECHPEFHHDDDRNSTMVPVPYPNKNGDKLRAELLTFRNIFTGMGSDPRTQDWFNSCRLFLNSHSSKLVVLQGLAGGFRRMFSLVPSGVDAMKKQYKSEFAGREFEFNVYSPIKIREKRQQLLVVACCLYTLLFAVAAAFFFGLRFLNGYWN